MSSVVQLQPTRRRPTGQTQLLLLAPPWPPIYSPALGIASLAAYCQLRAPARRVIQSYAYLRWLALLRAHFGDDALAIYQYIAEEGAYSGTGDLLFAGALGNATSHLRASDSLPDAPSYVDTAWEELFDCAEEFAEDESARLIKVAGERCVLGVSSTFTQTFAGLAIAQRFSASRPDVPIVFGGENFGPEKANIYFREFPFVDAIVFGDGETPLQSLLLNLDHEQEITDCQGLIVRPSDDGEGPTPATSEPCLTPMDEVPAPSMAPYFAQLKEAHLTDEFVPKLSWELSRGCWWGERRHCTFCGLNGSAMTYRRRNGSDVAGAIVEQLQEHQTLDLMVVDNILHPEDITRVFERLPADMDLQVHLEVKANLSSDQLRTLRDHGVWHVQPGIESLARKPLQLMRKGVTPWMNVRFLRDAEALGLTVAWNILVGFPGEDDSDYEAMLRNLPLLFHLQPPSLPTTIALVRHSPLFEDPELRMPNPQPAKFNRLLWPDLSDDKLMLVSNVFSSPVPAGISGQRKAQVGDVVRQWRDAYPSSSLVATTTADSVIVTRSSPGVHEDAVAEIPRDGWQFPLWQLLNKGASRDALSRFAAEERAPEHDVNAWVDELVLARVVLRDGGVSLALPVQYVDHLPVKIQ